MAEPERAAAMREYMKDVAPFLGIASADRRRAAGAALRGIARPTGPQLCDAAVRLWRLGPREYRYCACELVGRYVSCLDADELDGTIRVLLTTTPWWDTVDSLGSNAVTPMVVRYPELVAVMWDWNRSDDRWLIRASIQHQRGLKGSTDVPRLLAMCDAHARDREFFIAKAIGWALRDVCRFDAPAVRSFLEGHPGLPTVARREAERGLARLNST